MKEDSQIHSAYLSKVVESRIITAPTEECTVTVIYVNFKSEYDIFQSVASLCRFDTPKTFEVIVVSNSKLESGFDEKLKSLGDFGLKCVQLNGNYGFALANNVGALEASTDFLFFLNPDCIAKSALIEPLHKNAKLKQAIWAPITVDENGEYLQTEKAFLSKENIINLAFPFLYESRFRVKKSKNHVFNGHALFIRKLLFTQLGMMNDDYFLYCEEDDICKQADEQSIPRLYCEIAKVEHIQGTSTSPFLIPLRVEMERSNKKYLMKYHPDLLRLNRLMGIIAFSWRTLAALVLGRFTKAKMFAAVFNWFLFSYDEKTPFKPN